MTEVAAALIWENGKFLICQRPPHKGNALLWEFVGGKLEKGETHAEALQRECTEELGVKVEVNEPFCEIVHTYPDITIHLTVFNSEIISGELCLLEHVDLRWITPDEIENYDFCVSAKPILEKIAKEAGK